jgi:hypothetical protein
VGKADENGDNSGTVPLSVRARELALAFGKLKGDANSGLVWEGEESLGIYARSPASNASLRVGDPR